MSAAGWFCRPGGATPDGVSTGGATGVRTTGESAIGDGACRPGAATPDGVTAIVGPTADAATEWPGVSADTTWPGGPAAGKVMGGGNVVIADETVAASIETAGLRVEVADTVGATEVMGAEVEIGGAVAEMGALVVCVNPEAAVVVAVGVAADVPDKVQLMVARPWVILCEAPGLVKS